MKQPPSIYGHKDLRALSRRIARRKLIDAIKNHSEEILVFVVAIIYIIGICFLD